jgi:hypothetical protein
LAWVLTETPSIFSVVMGMFPGAGKARVYGKGRLETPFVSNQACILGQTVRSLTGGHTGQRFQRQWPCRCPPLHPQPKLTPV